MLRPNWFHVLVALTARPLHGSAIAEDVLDRTGGSLRLWPATLYRALDELVEAGFVEELPEAERPEGESRRKRYYRVTSGGRDAVAREAERLEGLARDARSRLGRSS
jgi:DNA-binding PadR family transcriptional regulator